VNYKDSQETVFLKTPYDQLMHYFWKK